MPSTPTVSSHTAAIFITLKLSLSSLRQQIETVRLADTGIHTAMRPGAELYTMVHGPAAAGPSSSVVSSSSVPRSPWQSSPVPYLFGGLAAMLGLIALSLLGLACSYWQLAGSSEDGGGGQAGEESRADGGEKGSAAGAAGAAGEWRGHVVVIMAGDERPTFLATPAWSRAADAVEPAASSSTEGKTAACEASTQPVAGSEHGAPPRQVQSPTDQQTSRSSVALAL
ncbi:hypothetical protein GUJ93_ZPchr0002g23905 [Zizania palustris]|uniref:Uncharacterized protein n=1 Tax=Zizania palustris TaxID=103762 RepID=A0A8J5VAV1_ZIZPA|nr:hypothetical protein GUJ93_ZPchr0002g23905 [Zizania palustris]